ncbi:hypothetical protein QFC22_004730 [Naganishia vaughanmartiniae]|uniref:Uncharacterized protein n=1 Tax=Naganishia vaughanmartiniae TaxID=1424756 RepID=A0ACC2WWY2_9TREE|nr:hypothetical protein QFC22_004730 [Naganishia vaughanmartiniae]
MIPTISARRRLLAAVSGQRHQRLAAATCLKWTVQGRSSSSAAASATVTQQQQQQQHLTRLPPQARISSGGTSILAEKLGKVYDILEAEVGGEEEWSRRVEDALRRLREAEGSKARVAVYSDPPQPSLIGAGNVVTSLLLDPFAEDEPTRLAIAQRHSEPHAGAEYVIRYAEKTVREIDSLACNSPWLRDANVDLVEIVSQNTQTALSSLLASDIILLILDPIRLLETPRLSTLVPELETKRGVYFVVDGEIPGSALTSATEDRVGEARTRVEQRLKEQLSRMWKRRENGNDSEWPKPLFMHSERGISAIHALRQVISLSQSAADAANANAPGSIVTVSQSAEEVRSRAFREFQERYVASNLGDVSQFLIADIRRLAAGTTVTAPGTSTTDLAGSIESQTATHVLRRSLHYIDSVLTALTAQSLHVKREATALRESAEDEERDILLLASTTWRRSLQEEMQKTRDAVARVLKARFGGWRVLTGRAERVEEEVGGQVVAHWGYALTQQLAFDTGRLEQIHRSLSQKTDILLRSFAAPHSSSTSTTTPFFSPVLINSLSQLEQTHQITPAALTSPIHARRTQLLSFVVPVLQKRAYATAYTAWSLVFASTSLSWTACVPLELLDPASSLGVGLLGSMAAFRWAVGAWQKAQTKFWADWERVEAGLEHDLGRDLSEVVQGRVVAKALAGAEGLEALVKKRMARVDDVDRKVQIVREDL